jgi:penicillin-binding protein 1B
MRKIFKNWKRTLFWSVFLGTCSIVGVVLAAVIYYTFVNHTIDERIAQLHSSRSSIFYALYPSLQKGQTFTHKELRNLLEDEGYSEIKNVDDLKPGEFAWADEKGPSPAVVVFRAPFNGAGHMLEKSRAKITFAPLPERPGALLITDLVRLDVQQPVDFFESAPKQVGSFFAGRLRTQNSVALSDMPISVRYAVIAIEDNKFLEHYGVSFRGTLRALFKNLLVGRWVQGGSTITQQLMKNLFFSNKKVISRKFKEALFALITEARYSKEEILEAYLNEVYLGQWGTHEIHGMSEASRFYFNRPVTELSLSQSAALAALIQAPNAQDPYRYAARLLKRRNLVLKKMLDGDFIVPQEYQEAVAEPIGVVPSARNLVDIDYFLDVVMERLPDNVTKRLDSDVFSVYLTMNPYLQSVAAHAMTDTIAHLQKISPAIRAKSEKGIQLQGAIIAVDVKSCGILALQGGRSYRQTQFNRVLQGKRQPGSLFKPFVALAALSQNLTPPVTALTVLDDAPFEWKYEKQEWKPRNYDNKFRGEVTVRDAIEQSLNVPTAKLAQMVGVAPIIETLKRAGIESKLPEFPSISLGSAEVSPLELAEAYTTLASMGKYCYLRAYAQIFDENNNLVTENKITQEDRLPPIPTFQTIDIMKGVIQNGTGKSALLSGLNLDNFAGKSGTTNDFKDAWFVGFSPDFLSLVWIGYDEENKVGLSGAVAALPAWVDMVKAAYPLLDHSDFVMPAGLERFEVDESTRALATPNCPKKHGEYFVPGTQPSTTCAAHP